MPTRAEILEILAASQTQVLAFFAGLSPHDLERPATASELAGAAPWSAKDHLAHLVNSERNIQRVLRAAHAGAPRAALLRLQYPADMPLPRVLGAWEALSPAEQERLEVAVARRNQAYVHAHHDDSLELIAAAYQAARQETVALVQELSEDQLAAALPLVTGSQVTGDVVAGRAEHAARHLSWIEEGWRQGV